MFKKPEDISPLPTGMMDAFNKAVNSQLGNYDTAQEAPAPEAPTAEADIPEQQVEEGTKVEGNAFTKALNAARDNGDDEFIVSGKKYRVEDYDEDEEDEDDEEDKEDKEELDEDNTNDKSDDGEGLDKVQPKAVKKKFKDRKDKDIDNDGDTDDSDEYLHKRRKAISKALTKESVELEENRNLLKDYEELKKKGKSDSQAQDVLLSMPQYKRYNSSKLGKLIGDALRKGTISKKAPFKLAEESGDLGKPEGFFSEEMDPTDHVRFNKETNMFCVYDKDGKKVYESEKEEEANKYAIDNHDTLMGKAELADSKSASGYDLYHKDFSGAMQHAYAFAKKKGFVVDKNDIDRKVATGPKKPSSGKTNSYILKTNKKKNVHIQVANLDNKRYELNMYIESVDLEEGLPAAAMAVARVGSAVYSALKDAIDKGKDEFIASGKKYKVKDFSSLEEAPITGIQGKDNKKYSIELDKSGRKVMVRTKNQFGDIKTISLKQAAKLFEASDLEKLEERKIDPADMDDMKATKGDKESAKMNIIVQLRKAADVKGNLDIVFADGKKQKVPANIIKIALDKFGSFRKPATKDKLVTAMSKSYRDMLKALKTIKEYSEESGSEES